MFRSTRFKDPNFPDGLDIRPSTSLWRTDSTEAFGIVAQETAIQRYGIAGRVWEAAYLLITYITPPPHTTFDPPFLGSNLQRDSDDSLVMIELGSGSGIVSSVIASAVLKEGDCVVVTDLLEVCPLLEKNLSTTLQRSQQTKVLVRPLAWGDHQHVAKIAEELNLKLKKRRLSHVICSDLVYFPELLAPLLRTLLELSSPSFFPFHGDEEPNDPTVVISYKIRSLAKETPFWSAFGLWFSFHPVLAQSTTDGTWRRFGTSESDYEGDDDDDRTMIFIAHRRPESRNWQVPLTDRELLSGSGARGTPLPKMDDTFESLLLMSVNGD